MGVKCFHLFRNHLLIQLEALISEFELLNMCTMFLGTGISVVQTQVIGKNAWTWYSVEVRGYVNMPTAAH